MRSLPKHSSEQHGVAVILALLVVVLAALIVGGLLWQQNSLMATVLHQKVTMQANELQKTSVYWAERILREDARISSNDDLTEPWAQPLAEVAISEAFGNTSKETLQADTFPNAFIAGQIEDAQAKFNLQNLFVSPYPNKREFLMFKKLLKNLGLDENLSDKLRKYIYPDWQESDNQDTGAAPTPSSGMTKVKPLLNVAELRGVLGNAAYDKLLPFVVCLPDPTPVNANTTTAEVLSAKIENLDLATAKRLIGERKIGIFKDVFDVLNRIGGLNLNASESDISTKTLFFFVNGRLRFDQINIRYLSLVQRIEGKTTVLFQRQM